MFDNVAFQVVIGLVFVYLLYSLLVTIVSEIIATRLNIRARFLRIAIERMLNDGYYRKEEKRKSKIFQPILRFFLLYEPPEFEESVAGQFYRYPAIKYLGRIEAKKKWWSASKKPSYISADYFADALIGFLADKGVGDDDMQRVTFCLRFNTYQVQPKTLKQLRTLLDRSAGVREQFRKIVMQWFNETMDRATTWHKRQLRVISFWMGFIIAVAFNVDTIRIAQILAKDKQARSELVAMGVALAKDSSRYATIMRSDEDSMRSEAILDSGLTQVTRDIHDANLVLGLGWDNSRLYSIEEEKVKSVNDRLQPILKSYFASQKLSDSLKNSMKDRVAVMKMQDDTLKLLEADSTVVHYQQMLDDTPAKRALTVDALLKARQHIAGTKLQILQHQVRNTIDSLNALYARQRARIQLSRINALAKTKFQTISLATQKKDEIFLKGKQEESFLFYFFHVLFTRNGITGMLITALALSLGAPFWFDLLKKLVAIRGDGIKPEEKKVAITDVNAVESSTILATTTQPREMNPAGDPVEAAIRTYGPTLRLIPGVRSVFAVMIKSIKHLQINVIDKSIQAAVKAELAKLQTGNLAIPTVVVVAGTPNSQQGFSGIISNRSNRNGRGSLGCILENKDFGTKHLLSCWHVLKGDLNYSDDDESREIVEHPTQKKLGERWAGGITDQFDYGLARCEDINSGNQFLKEKLKLNTSSKLKYRFLSKKEIEQQIPVLYYDCLSKKLVNGFIYSDTTEVDISYVDKTRTIRDVILLTNDEGTALSTEGNSGSIVFDRDKRAIAMIIAGDSQYSYAVKLSHVFGIHTEMRIA